MQHNWKEVRKALQPENLLRDCWQSLMRKRSEPKNEQVFSSTLHDWLYRQLDKIGGKFVDRIVSFLNR